MLATLNDHTRQRPEASGTDRERALDDGYTLIEMLLVVLILGIMASAVVLAVGGMRTEAADSGCRSDRRRLEVAAESYFARTRADQIPGPGADHDRYELSLVDAGFLRAPSSHHDLDADGIVTPQEGSPC